MCVLMVSCRLYRMSASPLEILLVLWSVLKTVGDNIKATEPYFPVGELQCLTDVLLILANLGFLSYKTSCLWGGFWLVFGILFCFLIKAFSSNTGKKGRETRKCVSNSKSSHHNWWAIYLIPVENPVILLFTFKQDLNLQKFEFEFSENLHNILLKSLRKRTSSLMFSFLWQIATGHGRVTLC